MADLNTPVKINAIKVVLWAQAMDRALAFYTRVLGFSERFRSEHWSELSWGDTIIALHGGGDGSARTTNLSLQVDDLDAACASIAEHGGLVVDPPVARPGEPIRLATIADTEGNRLMLTQYLG